MTKKLIKNKAKSVSLSCKPELKKLLLRCVEKDRRGTIMVALELAVEMYAKSLGVTITTTEVPVEASSTVSNTHNSSKKEEDSTDEAPVAGYVPESERLEGWFYNKDGTVDMYKTMHISNLEARKQGVENRRRAAEHAEHNV